MYLQHQIPILSNPILSFLFIHHLTTVTYVPLSAFSRVRGPVDIIQPPLSSKGLDGVGNNKLFLELEDGQLVRVKSGHVFTLTTKDPDRLPLSSFKLLEMQ